ncbi:unnamed protein product [Adineta steineri]|uniref:Target of rapamycin complex subunit lst8 n=1 Tax=Adineta steineri TaxID=433720 RepID=A0A814EHK7_9BILA|nr:unnamed protein product [Adineta steineri]CAF3971016.1 unnamed protein product [Adineta steineri]
MSSPNDGILFITAGYDRTIRFWHAGTAAIYRTIMHEDSPTNCLAIHPQKTLLAAGSHQHIKMYDLLSNNPNPVMKLDQLQKNIVTLGFSDDKHFMFSGGEDHCVRIWDMRAAKTKAHRQITVGASVNCVTLHPNQAELLIGDQDGTIYRWDMAGDKNEKHTIDANNPSAIRSISINRDASMMAAVTSNGDCQIWSMTGFSQTHLIRRTNFLAHKRYALKCLFSPDMTLLATTSADGTAKIWRTSDLTCQYELKHDKLNNWVWDCAFTSDSLFVVTVCSDGKARLWSTETGDITKEYIGHQKPATCLASHSILSLYLTNNMVQTSPTPFDVGRAFVHQYYTLLHQAPNLLHRFYSTDSTFIHGGVDRPGSIEQPAVGPENIARRINDLNLQDCHAKIRQVDSHPTIGNGVVVQVTGELSNNGDPMRRFMQTFVLAPRQPKKYYVQNDIFRYQDEVFDDGSDEDDGSSSQIYGDTDKVSNADSSAAVTQQPLVVPPTSRPPVEEQQQQHQPLPPRNTGNQQQVNSNQTVRQQQQQQQQETPVNGLTESTTFNGQPETIQESQQQTKQPIPEGTSYAGIAKLHSSTGPTSNVNSISTIPVVAPTQQINTARPSTAVKPTSNQQQRGGSGNYYQQNNRGNQWNNDNHTPQDPNSTRRSGPNTPAAPNEQQVFVGSLPAEFTQATLIECFSQYGKVLDAKIHRPTHDNKKSFGFVIFEDPEIASKVVKMEHVNHENARLNVEPKTQKGSYQGNANNASQGNGRNNYQRGGGGMNRGGNRGPYRGSGNNQRRGGGQYHNNSSTFTGGDENYKVQQQQPQPQQQQQ